MRSFLLFIFLAFFFCHTSFAQTFTVNNLGDTNDAVPGNGACADGLGNCTLRAAIQEANALAGTQTINFGVAGTINVLTTYISDITSPMIIDGTSAPGYAANAPTIIINANGNGHGFIVNAGSAGTDIRGLQIRNWGINAGDIGLYVTFTNNVTVRGCQIWNDGVAPVAAFAANQAGITITGSTNVTIGGAALADRNVISDNSTGIIIDGSSGVSVLNSYIGTNLTGTGALPNSGSGILIQNTSTNNTIGGTLASSKNIIANNAGNGITLVDNASIGNTIQGNAIFSNGGVGIDIDNNGAATPNGPNPRLLPNQGQNFPTLSAAISNATNTTITGVLNSAATQNYRIEFFSNITADGSGNGEGETYLGFVNVTTDGAGIANFTYTVGTVIPTGRFISATATNTTSNNTSEFAINTTVVSSILIVNSTADTPDLVAGDGICGFGGICTLRAAIEESNAFAGTQTIQFAIPTADAGYSAIPTPFWSIRPLTGLPVITDQVTIDGWSQTGFSGTPLIEINGVNISNGFGLNIQANNCQIRGLVINNFNSGAGGNDVGIGIFAGTPTTMNNWIYGCYIGTDITGTVSVPNDQIGIWINTNANGNLIGTNGDGTNDLAERNIISGNGGYGTNSEINIQSTDNKIKGNYIGTNVTGTADITVATTGVNISADNTEIGGQIVAEEGNLISGINGSAISITTSTGCLIRGNKIGTNASGTNAIPNQDGISIFSGATNNVIGGIVAGARNIISGNTANGINIGTNNNTIQGNYIGVDKNGTNALGNVQHGIVLSGDSNAVGGSVAGAGNIISGNSQIGIVLFTSSLNQIQGNYVGTDASGTALIPNLSNGISLQSSANNNIIGGTVAGARNVVSGNSQGITIDLFSIGNTVQGNYIGTDVNGTIALGNMGAGLILSQGSNNNIVGGGNLISGNGGSGIFIGTNNNTIKGNYIGTNAAGTAGIANQGGGISIFSANNTVGGTTTNARNVISSNFFNGILIQGTAATGNTVQGNYIGTAADGVSNLGNSLGAIRIDAGASNNTIGGTVVGAGNIIANSTDVGIGYGVGITGATSIGNLISRNTIFGNRVLGIDLETNGVTANDAQDIDNGANTLQNFPVLTLSTAPAGTLDTQIQGTFNSAPSATFIIEFFANPLNQRQGRTYLGTTSVATDAAGNAPINVILPNVVVLNGYYITATATNTTNNTSEFAAQIQHINTNPPSNIVTNTNDSGAGSLRNAINYCNANIGLDTVKFAIPNTDLGYVVSGDYFSIKPTSALPTITDQVLIDGYNQTGSTPNTLTVGNNAKLRIEIDGNGSGIANGLIINTNNSTVKGLCINGFSQNNISFTSPSTGNLIAGCFIGTNILGTASKSTATITAGINLPTGADANKIGTNSAADRNLISGNTLTGITPGILVNSNDNTFQNNYIGTNAQGTAPLNNYRGIEINNANNNLIDNNLLSGNTWFGIDIGGNSTNTQVLNNKVGTNATGTAAVGNNFGGVDTYWFTTSTIIRNNLISGNGTRAMNITSSGHIIQGNKMGTDISGTAAIPNGDGSGVSGGIILENGMSPTTNILIGGTNAGEGNIIAFNNGDGILRRNITGAGMQIVGNSIFSNNRLGIDLSNTGVFDGVTANDGNDVNFVGDFMQNYPDIATAIVSPSGSGTQFSAFNLNTIDGTYRLEFFSNTTADPSGNGEGQTFLGSTNVTVTANNFSPTLPYIAPVSAPLGTLITITATNLSNNTTSEFSVARPNCNPVITAVSDVSFATCVGITALVRFTASGAPDGSYTIDLNGTQTTGGTMTSGVMTVSVSPNTLINNPTITHSSGCTSSVFPITFNTIGTGSILPPAIQGITLTNPTRCDKPNGRITITVSSGSAGQGANVDINNDGIPDYTFLPITSNNQIIIDNLDGGISIGSQVVISLPALSCVSAPFSFSGTLAKLALPSDKTPFTINPSDISPQTSTTIVIPNPEAQVSYQLRNTSTNTLIGKPITAANGAITLTTEVLTKDASYEIIAQNTVSNCLSILAQKADIKVVYGLNPDDSLIVAEIYQTVMGVIWDRTQPLSKWNRIIVRGGRVISLDLSNLGLRGAIPETILRLRFLTQLSIQQNQYQFPAFERFLSLNISFSITYNPQADVYEAKDTTAFERSNVIFNTKIDGNNRYQWLKDGVPIANNTSATTSLLRLSRLRIEDEGTYTCLITNPQAPQLTIRRNGIRLTVRPLAVNVTDSLILVKFAQGLGVENWKRKWDFTKQVSTWEGLIFEKGQIVGINLIDNGLKGTIPDVFESRPNILSKLKILNLSRNQISGNIPTSMALLTELEYLDLSQNQFVGKVPTNIYNLKTLLTLWLSYNKFNLLEKEIANLTNLKNLFLNDNELPNLPDEIVNLANLEISELQNNQLRSLPNNIANLSKLTFLDISNNQLASVPLSITNLSSLQTLFMHNNLFKTLPTGLSNLKSLKEITFYNNFLEFGSIEPLRAWWDGSSARISTVYAPQGNIGTAQDLLGILGQNISFSIQTTGSANIYKWFKNNELIANTTSQTLTINQLKASDVGIYYVQVTNRLVPNLTLQSQNYTLQVDCSNAQTNKPQIQVRGAAQFCANELINTQLLATATDVTYQWLLNGVKIGNANENTFLPKEAGKYRLQVTDRSGCSYTSDEVTISISTDFTVTIRRNGDVLEAVSDRPLTNFEWFLNTNLLQNSNARSINVVNSGNYTVRAADNLGCRATSRAENVVVTGFLDTDWANSVKIYPNPSEKTFYLTSKDNSIKALKIYDLLGKIVKEAHFFQSTKEYRFDLESQTSGLYFIEIMTEKGNFVYKIIKE